MKKILQKKITKIILIVLSVLIVVSIVFIIVKKNKTKDDFTFSYVRTIQLSKSALEETVVSSGTIESQTTSTITSSVSNATVSKINYAVGDYVKEGDVIIELDTTNLNKQITKQSGKITDQEEMLQEKYDDAEDNYDDAEDAYNSAKTNYNNAKSKLDTANNEIKEKQEAYDAAVSEYNNAYKELVEAYPDVVIEKTGDGFSFKNKNGNPIENEYTDAYIEKNKLMNDALVELNNVKEVNNYDALVKAYEEATNSYSQAREKYKQAESSFEEAEDALNDGVDTDQLDELYDTVADYKLKAKSSGQITSINAVLGSSTNGTLATIQDTSKLKISLTIDEYDILKIKLGMKANIETDASDVVYDGVVSQISPVASSGSMGSSGGFEIEVQVTSNDVSNLLIGMNAEVTIILSTGEENYNVPIDAVETKEDGTSVIYVRDDSGDFYEVSVVTGNASGYYIEIFGDDLKDGMVVRASANEDEANINNIEDEVSTEEGSFDLGFGLGGAPSGGFSGGPSGDGPSGGGPSGGGSFPGGR